MDSMTRQDSYNRPSTELVMVPEQNPGSLRHPPPNPPGAMEGSLKRLHSALADLLYAVKGAFEDNPQEVYAFVSRALTNLDLDSSHGVANADPYDTEAMAPLVSRGCLAPWQIRKVSTYIETHLGIPITAADLAGLVRLSVYHFCRVFRVSFDETPHAYVMRRRIERAQGLMLQTNSTIAQIASECGLSDQSHFNRSFRRLVGETPGAWRRARLARI